MIKFNPLGDRILIKPDDPESAVYGMDIPETAKEKPVSGTVVAIGPKVNKTIQPITEVGDTEFYAGRHFINVGDRVVYSQHALNRIEVYGEEGFFLREGDCHFVISQETQN